MSLEILNLNFWKKRIWFPPLGQGPILTQLSVARGLIVWPAAHSLSMVEAHSEREEIGKFNKEMVWGQSKWLATETTASISDTKRLNASYHCGHHHYNLHPCQTASAWLLPVNRLLTTWRYSLFITKWLWLLELFSMWQQLLFKIVNLNIFNLPQTLPLKKA